jgi:adenosylhomocysteine nucleosidase
MIRIVILFALPQEYGCLKRLMGSWRFTTREPLKSFVRQDSSKELVLIETGMGRDRMLGALEWLLGRTHPDLVIAAGFAGSLTQELAVGDACLGEAFASLDVPSHSEAGPRIGLEISQRLVRFCEEHRIRRTQIVTVSQPAPKQQLNKEYENNVTIMDMESYFVGRFCCEKNIPFLSFRAISDGLLDEIDFELAAITDARGQVKIPLVLKSILKNPRLLRTYYLSWKRSMQAARSLGKVLFELLHLPPTELRSLISEAVPKAPISRHPGED